MSEPRSFWAELRQRRVPRVGLFYLAAGWAVFEGSGSLTDAFALPDFTPRLVFTLVALGFPIALILAWAFQVTPEGVERVEPFAHERGGSRAPLFAGVAIGLISLAGAALALRGGEDAVPVVRDPGLVAVLPFRVSGPEEMQWLGAGVMELLAYRFDGEFGPRAVDPGVVANSASDGSRADSDVASAVGAGLFVTGSIIGDAGGSIFNAELRTTQGGEVRAQATQEAHPDSLVFVADRLYAQLLSLAAGEDQRTVADLTSQSVPALKEYLQGKASWREGAYFEAAAHYDRAIQLDSTFALAGIARADAANMATGAGGGGGLDLAVRHRDRLGPRDLAYLEARRPDAPRTRSEAIDGWRALTRAQPDRVEAWYWLGELLVHWRTDPDPRRAEEAKTAFEKALDLDPDYFPAIDHLMMHSVEYETLEEFRRYAGQFFEYRPEYIWLRDIASGGDRLVLDPEEQRRVSNPNFIILGPIVAPIWIDHTPENFEAFVNVAIDEALRRAGVDAPLGAALEAAFEGAVAYGQFERARAIWDRMVDEGVRNEHDPRLLDYAAFDRFAHPDVEETVRIIEAAAAELATVTRGQGSALIKATVWRFRTDSTYQARSIADKFLASAAEAPHPDSLTLRAYSALASALTDAREGNRAAGVASMDVVDRIVALAPPGARNTDLLLAMSSVWDELDEPARALEVLKRHPYFAAGSATHIVEIWRASGRLAEQLGDVERARTEYERYLKVRFDPDPEVRAELDEVLAALRGLEGG